MVISVVSRKTKAIIQWDRGQLSIAIAIPTANRPEILAEVLPHLAAQVRKPDAVIVCAPNRADIPPDDVLTTLGIPVSAIIAERGLCRQRNRILAEANGADIVLFLDDDFLLAPNYLLELERLFLTDPDIALCTGTVDADGILGPGYTMAEGLALLERATALRRLDRSQCEALPAYNGYGCNMAVRMQAVRESGARFDEALPLYGWLEDVDFSRQVARWGKIVRSTALHGIHLGTKVGRTPGQRLGYSQIANPVYLIRKNTMAPRRAGMQMVRNILANTAKSLRPEPWVDRRGRLKGNLRAIADLALGRLEPGKILMIE